ncbi:MAG TPA: glycosyltransferase family 9 protein [Candidatus Rubrimentiphilum sp.]|nr:glycosyltransferase family 9 protein [Candidatus Rubrimentiphilum sp.]
MLIVRLDAIGDALALVPLIAALRERGASVDVVLRPANAGVFSKDAVNAVHVATFPLRDSSPEARREIARLGSELAAAHYDYALIATEDLAGYQLARVSGARRRIGFENGWGKPLKTLWARLLCTSTVHRTAGLDPRAPHESQVLFSLGRDIVGGSAVPRDPTRLRPFVIDSEPAPDDRVVLQVTDKWNRMGASLDDLVALARTLSARHTIRFISAAVERAYAKKFSKAAGVSIEYFAELEPWKEAIASAKAIVAPDSGAVHVAGMVGTPTVAVFAVQNFALQTARWSPWASPYRVVKLEGAWPVIAADALEDLLRDTAATYKG